MVCNDRCVYTGWGKGWGGNSGRCYYCIGILEVHMNLCMDLGDF